MASHSDYPGVTSRKGRKGETIWRYRSKGRNGTEIRLPGQPGDPEFEAAYGRVITGQAAKASVVKLPGMAMAKTFGHAARLLEATMEWRALSDESRQKYAGLTEEFLESRVDPNFHQSWRHTPVAVMTADDLRSIITGIFTKYRTKASYMLISIKKLLWIAIEVEKWIKPQDDPSLSIRVRIPKSTKNPAWPLAVREKFEGRHPIGTPARTCYALGLWLGNRRGDIASLGWDELMDVEIEMPDGSIETVEVFDFRQMKNRNRNGGKEMFIPVVDKLAEALAPLDRSKGGTVLKNRYGRSYKLGSLSKMLRFWARQADIPDGYTLHGLRRTFGTYLADSEIQSRTIMEQMGHSSLATTDIYVREANKRRMAVDVARVVNSREERRDAMKRRSALRIVK